MKPVNVMFLQNKKADKCAAAVPRNNFEWGRFLTLKYVPRIGLFTKKKII